MALQIDLNIDVKHFKMLHTGEQKEAYRKITPAYKRIFTPLIKKQLEGIASEYTLCFSSGRSKDRPQFYAKLLSITIGEGRQEWGAEKGIKYYVLEIKVIEK